MILISLLFFGFSSISLAQDYNSEGNFINAKGHKISKSIKIIKTIYPQIQKSINLEIFNKDYNNIKYFFGEKNFKRNLKIIHLRLEFMKILVNKLNIKKIKSTAWARIYHPNIDFILEGLPPITEDCFLGAVNGHGLQNIEEELWIEDTHIYLTHCLFEWPEEIIVTITHELSHQLGYTEKTLDEHPENNEIAGSIPTRDLELPLGSENAILDAYIWEKFIMSY